MCEFNKIDFSFFYPPLGDFIQPCFDTKQNRNNELMKQEVNQEQNISYNLSRDSKHLVVTGFCRFCGFCGFCRFCGFRLKQDSWRQRVTLDYKMKINHIFLHKCNLFVFTSTCLTCSLSCAGLLIRWTYRFHSLWGHLTQTVMKVDTEFNRTSAVLTLPRATNQQLSSAADWNRGRGLRVTDRSRLDEECCNWRGGAAGGGGWRWTHAGPEVRGVQLRVVLVLHGVVHAVALPHQVVMSAQDGGVNFGQIWEENSNMTKIMFVVKVF